MLDVNQRYVLPSVLLRYRTAGCYRRVCRALGSRASQQGLRQGYGSVKATPSIRDGMTHLRGSLRASREHAGRVVCFLKLVLEQLAVQACRSRRRTVHPVMQRQPPTTNGEANFHFHINIPQERSTRRVSATAAFSRTFGASLAIDHRPGSRDLTHVVSTIRMSGINAEHHSNTTHQVRRMSSPTGLIALRNLLASHYTRHGATTLSCTA